MNRAPVVHADWPAPAGVHAFTTLRHGAGHSATPFDTFNLGNKYAADGDDPAVVARNRAQLAELGGGEGFLLRLDLAGDLLLDRQTVAVPARHVRRAVAAHGAVAERDVLEGLVQRGADVDVAVGEGRTVVEDEGRAGGVFGLDAGIEVEFLPVRHPLRFASHEVGPHGKIGLGQVQGVFQVVCHAE